MVLGVGRGGAAGEGEVGDSPAAERQQDGGADGVEVFAGAAEEDGAAAGGVVTDAAADVALAAGGGVGGEEEAGPPTLPAGELIVEVVDGDAGLDDGAAVGGVDFEDRAAAGGEVDDDRAVGALTGERGAAAAGKDGEVVRGAEVDSAESVIDVGGDDDAQGLDLVEGGIGGVEHAVVET
jgi:hypothetical protein